jgi:capsular polysaccharide export protein
VDRFDDTAPHPGAGQVEDDRSILTGGSGLVEPRAAEAGSRARARRFLIYKPHPDVVAGHRKGYIAEAVGRQFADKVVTDASISSLIAMVDEVHVNTSLAGFEALMRPSGHDPRRALSTPAGG